MLTKDELWRVLAAVELDRKSVVRNQNQSRYPDMGPVFAKELAVLDVIKAKLLQLHQEAKK